MVDKGVIEINEPQEMTQGREHALANMISSMINSYSRLLNDQGREWPSGRVHGHIPTHLGNLSASSTTQLTPSRTNADAVYEPPGPPPMTSTVVSSGIDMFMMISRYSILMICSLEKTRNQASTSERGYMSIDPILDCQDSLNQYPSMVQTNRSAYGPKCLRAGSGLIILRSRSCFFIL